MLHAVIMAGGSGTRFWPQSRRATPKQLLRLGGKYSLIQETVDRISPSIPAERTWVVTNRLLAEPTATQLPEVPADRLLIEPCGRNTAPCLGLAAVHLLHVDPQAVMLAMPADHAIRPADVFRDAVDRAVSLVERDPRALVLFGARPSYAATEYGYIERGEALADVQAGYRVASFREKPARDTAEQYLSSGRFYWNCGIFVWRAQAILDALREFEPEMHDRLTTIGAALDTPAADEVLEREFPQMKSISIDFAVLERAAGVCVIEAPFAWDDLGSWQALERLLGADGDGNTIDGLHCGVDTRGCIIRGPADHLVATIGLEDCIVVHTQDATLVARKGDEGALRRLVERLQEQGHDRFL